MAKHAKCAHCGLRYPMHETNCPQAQRALCVEEEGKDSFAVRVAKTDDCVILYFDKPIAGVGFSFEKAATLAESILSMALQGLEANTLEVLEEKCDKEHTCKKERSTEKNEL